MNFLYKSTKIESANVNLIKKYPYLNTKICENNHNFINKFTLTKTINSTLFL